MGLVGSCPTQPIFDLLIKSQTFLFLNQPIKSNYTSRCKISFYFAQKKLFFYFTHSFLQNTHISLSILHIYSIKYSLFYNFLLFTLSLPLSLIEPQSHHYQRSLRTQPPSSPPNPHHQEKPTHSIQNPFNPKPINHPPNSKPSQAKSSPTQSATRSSKPTNEPEKTSRSRSKPTDQNIQPTHQNPSHHQPDQYPRINTHQNPHITSLRAPPQRRF